MNEPSGPDGKREARRKLDQRLRLAFLAGAEEQSRKALGRGLTDDELRRVIGRFPAEVSGR